MAVAPVAGRGDNRGRMTETAQPLQPLWRQLTWWTLVFPVVMIVAIARHDFYWLNWIHVLSGALWTGADLFMGFIIGPVLRRLDIDSRIAVISWLVPRTLLYYPILAATTGTAGWYLSDWLGFLSTPGPNHDLVVMALVLIAAMTALGLGILLPNSLRVWFELRRPAPDREWIVRINRYNIWLAGTQGVMQIAIILVMAKFVS